MAIPLHGELLSTPSIRTVFLWRLLLRRSQVEAIPTIICACITLFFLPSFPFSATFLTPREKAIAQARVQRDHQPTSHGGIGGWKAFKEVVGDVKCWVFAVIYCGCEFGYIFLLSSTLISDFHFLVAHSCKRRCALVASPSH
jgi:hypothetical protein